MSSRAYLVVSFDIASNRRRNRLVKILKDYNGRRVNLSVFECDIKREDYPLLREKIEAEINRKKDSVLFYDLCLNCRIKRNSLGINPFDMNESVVIKV